MTLNVTRRFLAALALCLAGAGCQSEGTEWKKHFNDSALKPPASAVEERFGKGPVEVSLLVPRGATGVYDDATRDVRDGAALAAAELGDAFVTVRVVDSSGGPQAAKAAAEAAAARKAGLLLSYNGLETTSAIASIPAASRPPIINLSQSAAGENAFNFQTDEIAAAAKAAQGASPTARKSVVIIAPVNLSSEQEKRLTGLIQQGGGQTRAVLRYQETGSEAGNLTASKPDDVQGASALLILGNTAAVGKVLAHVKKLNATAQILGTETWPVAAFANPAANGAIIGASEQEGSALIADRFKRHKGRTLTPNW